jgi:hypothetical protein
MRYLCLLIGEPGIEGPVPGTPEFTHMLSDYESATRAMAADGALVDSGPLQPPSSAATLRGPDVSLAPKKGYVSLRRPGKQFAMIQPSGAGRIDLGLILPGVPPAGRLESSASFNALFTHRVRVTSAGDLDDALAGWLAAAYAAAG